MSHNDNLTITQSDTDSACESCVCTQLPLIRHHLTPLARHSKTRLSATLAVIR